MRTKALLFTATFLAMTAAAAQAQQGRAQVELRANLTIPDVLLLAEGARSEVVAADGRLVTRTTVSVKANRGWSLGLTAADIAEIDELRVNGVLTDPRRALVHGRNTNAHEVTLEIKWKAAPRRLQYDLTAA